MTAEVETTAPVPEADPEIEFYEPIGVQLADGDSFIFDSYQFIELTGAVAMQSRSGQLFVLTEKLEWVSVEKLHEKPHGALRSIKAKP